MQKLDISVVVPLYNEEESLTELCEWISRVMKSHGFTYELLLVDDGSDDHSWEVIQNLSSTNKAIRGIRFNRNYGKSAALNVGFQKSTGDVIITMDADLQDPPELILTMIERWREGFEVVYAQRIARKQEIWFKRFLAYIFYRILRKLSDVDIPADTGDFCLMDRKVVDVLNTMPERNRYIRGLRAWVGFRQTAVHFERDPRFAGEVKYTFGKSWALAINGIISLSKVPLRLATYLGLLSASISLLMIFLVLYWRLFDPASPLMGFTIITITNFFLGSVQLFTIGILGEYIGRIYEEVKGRPIYTIKEVSDPLCGNSKVTIQNSKLIPPRNK